MQGKPTLTIDILQREAARFAETESRHDESALYGVTDGKAVGTYLEHKFVAHLLDQYQSPEGNSASGIDLPGIDVDIKVTSYRQPQSSCPFKSARQKIFGLGYHLVVFVYEKMDDHGRRTGRLNMRHTIFNDQSRTGDYQMTRRVLEILDHNANEDDLIALMHDRNLPVDEISEHAIAQEILRFRPELGYLTISNAQQWRLQYGHVIKEAGSVGGLIRIR